MEKEQKILLSIIGFTVLIFGIIFVAVKPNFQQSSLGSHRAAVNSENQLGGLLSAPETAFDFGKISMKDGKVTHRFTVKNKGTGEVTINKLYTSCMCTNAVLYRSGKKFGPFGMPGHGMIPSINQRLRPGEEVQVEVIFDPAAHGPAGVGRVERVVYLDNDASPRPFELRIAAEVTP